MRRITSVLAATGAALALAGTVAGCSPTPTAPVAAAKPLAPSTPATAASPKAATAPSTPADPSPANTSPITTKPGTTPPSTRAAAPSRAIAAKAAPGVPCAAAAVACVSLSKQEAWFVRDGKVVRGPIRVATGRAGYGTERGTFHVYRKNRMWYSTIYNNAPMPYSVFFDGGEAFHQGSTSVRSHGCVHVSAGNAAWIFSFLRIGDEVQVVR